MWSLPNLPKVMILALKYALSLSICSCFPLPPPWNSLVWECKLGHIHFNVYIRVSLGYPLTPSFTLAPEICLPQYVCLPDIIIEKCKPDHVGSLTKIPAYISDVISPALALLSAAVQPHRPPSLS